MEKPYSQIRVFMTLCTAVVMLFSASSCDDKDDNAPVTVEVPEVTFSNDTVTTRYIGGTMTVEYTSPEPIEVSKLSTSCNDSWITNIETSYYGSITFDIAKTEEATDRTGKIDVVYDNSNVLFSINVLQKGMPDVPNEMIYEKVWNADVAKFYPDETIYLKLAEDHQMIVDPDNGGYVYITARQYAEDFCKAYNAANPGENITIDDVLRFDFNEPINGETFYYEISFKEDGYCVVWYGSYMTSGFEAAVMCVSGPYTYDEKTGIITVRDMANSMYDRDVEYKVVREEGTDRLMFEVTKTEYPFLGINYEMFSLSFYNYDQTEEYKPAKKIVYYCSEIEKSRKDDFDYKTK